MTSGKKILGVTISVVAVLLVGKIGVGFLNQPDDKTLITEAIVEAQKAGKEGRPGGVLDFLSLNLNFNDLEVSTGRSDIANYIKNSKPDIKFTKIEPIITGEEARIETPATLTVGMAMFSQDIPIPNVVIVLKKEVDHEWLFIPKKSWKITQIRAPIDDLPSLPTGN
jgi:hypothetical protein